jgi:hypothetical protein
MVCDKPALRSWLSPSARLGEGALEPDGTRRTESALPHLLYENKIWQIAVYKTPHVVVCAFGMSRMSSELSRRAFVSARVHERQRAVYDRCAAAMGLRIGEWVTLACDERAERQEAAAGDVAP